jgi:hypothetical protein
MLRYRVGDDQHRVDRFRICARTEHTRTRVYANAQGTQRTLCDGGAPSFIVRLAIDVISAATCVSCASIAWLHELRHIPARLTT